MAASAHAVSDRSVAIIGSVNDNVIIAGDYNVVYQHAARHPLMQPPSRSRGASDDAADG